MRRAAAVVPLAVLALSGCAVFDPRLPAGPEESGYCTPFDAFPPIEREREMPRVRGCHPGFRRHYGAFRNRIGTADHVEQALALLRDRRFRMAERDRELAQIGAVGRVVTFGGLGTAAGAAAFGANRSLIVGGGLAGGAGYGLATGFATPGMRQVLAAGIDALNCVESKAFSARIQPLEAVAAGADASGSAPSVKRRDAQGRASALTGAAKSAREAAVATQQTAARALASDDVRIRAAANTAMQAAQQLLAAVETVRSGRVMGARIAAAVYERTLDIVNATNRELENATPNPDAIVALARGSAGLAVDGTADARQAASGAVETGVQASTTAVRASEALEKAAAPSADEAAKELRAIASDTERMTTRAAHLLTQLNEQQASALAQISGCAFEDAEGSAPLTVSPAKAVEVATGQTATFVVSGGRGPYRVTRTGLGRRTTGNPPEFSTGAVSVGAQALSTGETGTWLVEDFGNRAVAPVTLSVTRR